MAPRTALLSTVPRRADDINCCTTTDDGTCSAVLSIARARISPCSRYAYILRRVRRSPNNCLILGYDSVQSGINWLTLRRSLISPSRNEVTSLSQKLQWSLYQITRRQTSKHDVLKHFRPSDIQKSTCVFIQNCLLTKSFHKNLGSMIRHWSRRRVESSAYRNRKHQGTKTTGATLHHHHHQTSVDAYSKRTGNVTVWTLYQHRLQQAISDTGLPCQVW